MNNDEDDDLNGEAAKRFFGSAARAALDDHLLTTGSAPAVALGMLYIDAAWSLGMGMRNAVAEQQAAWNLQTTTLSRSVDLILSNSTSNRVVDVLLQQTSRDTGEKKQEKGEVSFNVKCPNGC